MRVPKFVGLMQELVLGDAALCGVGPHACAPIVHIELSQFVCGPLDNLRERTIAKEEF